MKITSVWVPQRAAADGLGVSERTLHRWRSAGLLKIGIHYRRKFPAANSPLLYQLELCEKAMNDAFARDHRTLELAGVA
jgi:predicted site-specific integrase-resolvase